MFYVNIMLTTRKKKKKPAIDPQRIKLRESRLTICKIINSQRKTREEERSPRIHIYSENNDSISSLYPSIITISVNGLDFLIKRHRVTKWIKNNKTL